MRSVLTYMFLLIALPAESQSKWGYSGRKMVSMGGSQFDIHQQGFCFGANPIFLVPMDTIGNVSFTGVINNIRVMGKFARYSCGVDSNGMTDPGAEEIILMYDSSCYVKKHGEWGYHCYDGISYYEYYDKGELVRRDSFQGVFKVGTREIKIVDSMARLRSIVDLYFKKGSN